MMLPTPGAARSRLPAHRWAAPAAGVLLALFLLLTAAVHLRLLEGVDLALARRLYYGPEVELLTGCATVTGVLMASQTVTFYSLAASLLLWRRGMGLCALAPMAFLLGMAVEGAMKLLVHQPLEPLREFHRSTFYPFFGMTLNGSYPSGHALRTAFILCTLAILLWTRGGLASRLAALGMVPLALMFGFTRLYIGDHWLSDVVGGQLLGAALALSVAPPLAVRLILPSPPERG